jgi:molybdopterin-guanine dinucleotide biosynthesis protein A
MTLAVLILAGGRATRMGGIDKPLLTIGGRSLVAHILDRLGRADPVAISANGDPARYAGFGLPILPDSVTGRGPLAGVLAGLHWAAALGADSLLSIPGETPFIPAGLAARLGAAPAWAENAAGLHPLVAVWPVSCAGALERWLAGQPSGQVRRFGATLGMRAVWFEDAPDPFLNINTPEDMPTKHV